MARLFSADLAEIAQADLRYIISIADYPNPVNPKTASIYALIFYSIYLLEQDDANLNKD